MNWWRGFKKAPQLPLVFELVISALLVALAIALSFATIRIGLGMLFLVSLPVILMPWLVRSWLALTSGLIAVLFADLINGWVAFTWISLLAYGAALIVLILVARLKFKWERLFLALILAAASLIAIYFLIEWRVFDLALAVADLITTSIQMAVTVGFVLVLAPLSKTLLDRFVIPRWTSH